MPRRFTPPSPPYPMWAGCVGPRTCLDGCGKSATYRDSITGPSSLSEWLYRLSYPDRRSNPSPQSWHKLFLLLVSCHSISRRRYRRVAHVQSCLHRNGAVLTATAGRPARAQQAQQQLCELKPMKRSRQAIQTVASHSSTGVAGAYWALGKC